MSRKAISPRPKRIRSSKQVADYVRTHHDAAYVPISAKIEAELIDLPPEEAKAFLKDLGVDDSGVSSLIKGTYGLLGLA